MKPLMLLKFVLRGRTVLRTLPTMCIVILILNAVCFALAREPLTFAPTPESIYVPPRGENVTTLSDLIQSRSELSTLAEALEEPAGFTKAFDTTPTWSFTFFAPSNAAFNNTSKYFGTNVATLKGKWWLGNLITHHYVPNTAIYTSSINTTVSRIQTATYLYVSAYEGSQGIVLNNVAKITEANIPISNGIVHIIDHILDPSAQIFEMDFPEVDQTFIAGSCSDPALSYC